MMAGKVAFRQLTQATTVEMAQHRLDNTQNTGSTLGMNLKEAMIDSDYDFKMA